MVSPVLRQLVHHHLALVAQIALGQEGAGDFDHLGAQAKAVAILALGQSQFLKGDQVAMGGTLGHVDQGREFARLMPTSAFEARISTMYIALATVVDEEERWDFSGCLLREDALREGGLTLFGVGDISAQP